MNIKKLEDKSLSTDDILKIMNHNVNIITYPSLKNYKSVEEIFKSSPNIILYFEEEKKGSSVIGHWEALKKIGKTIQFFDGYGIAPDYCRKWLAENNLVVLKENTPELTRLLNKAIDDGYSVFWNHNKYQSYNKDVSTCGKWATSFLLNGNLQNNSYSDWINSQIRKYSSKTYDEAICKWCFEKFGL